MSATPFNPKEYKRAWYLRNKERHAENFKRYYIANRETRLAYHKEYEKRIPGWKLALKNAKARAAKRELEFSLTKEWALRRWTGSCELTGLPFVKSVGLGGGPGTYSCSLDRIDSTKGYIPDNCRFVLACVNAFRGAATSDEEMLLIAKRLLEAV